MSGHKSKKKISHLFFGSTLRMVEFFCNLFMILLPLCLIVYSMIGWLKSGQFHWLAVKDFIEWRKIPVPTKLPTGWEGVNILYHKTLIAPLAVVSFFFGLALLFFGAVVASVAPKN